MKLIDRSLVMFGLLALATAVMLHGNLMSPFYRLDDQRYLRHATEGPWTRLLKPTRGMFFAPVTYLSFRLDRVLFGPPQDEVKNSFGKQGLYASSVSPGQRDAAAPDARVKEWAYGPRLMNALYHLLAAFCLWFFLRRIGAGSGLAAVAALAWAVHPAALESVAWVSERKNVLCALFGFSSLLAWTADRDEPWRLPLVWLLFALALFSKAAALGLVPLFVALEFANPPRGSFPWREGHEWAAALRRLSGQLVAAAVNVVITLRVFADDVAIPPGGSVWTALLTDVDIFARYTAHLLVPVNLSFFYGVEPITSLADPRLWLCGGMLALLWGAMLWRAGPKWRPLALLGFVWFFGALGPNANIVATTYPMQDRYAYLAAPGLLLALGVALKGLAERAPAVQRALPVAGAAFVALLAAMCAARSPLFGDDIALALDAARRQPDSGMARWSAAQIMRERFMEYANGTTEDEQRMARVAGTALITELEAALKCRDVCDFVDPLTLRVGIGEVLFFARNDAGARAAIEPSMPPPGPLPALLDIGNFLPDVPPMRRSHVRWAFFTESVAKGHVLLGEIDLHAAYLTAATAEQRLASARSAIARAKQSLAIHALHDEAQVLKGKALIRIAYLHAGAGAMAEARQAYAEAKAILEGLPATSRQSETAKRILSNVPPPQESGR